MRVWRQHFEVSPPLIFASPEYRTPPEKGKDKYILQCRQIQLSIWTNATYLNIKKGVCIVTVLDRTFLAGRFIYLLFFKVFWHVEKLIWQVGKLFWLVGK